MGGVWVSSRGGWRIALLSIGGVLLEVLIFLLLALLVQTYGH
jgi:hypothetical protein